MLLTFTELRGQLGITARSLSALVRDGLPHVVERRKKLFDAEAVIQWLLDTGRAEIEPDPPRPRIARTRRECADHFGVHLRTVADWLEDPTFPGRPGNRGQRDGFFPLEEIAEWIAARDAVRQGGPRVDVADRREELLAVRIQRESVRTERDRLFLEEHAGRLTSIEAMAELVTRQIHTCKTLLESLPDRAARDLPPDLPAETRSAIVRRWRDAIYEAERILSEMMTDQDETETTE